MAFKCELCGKGPASGNNVSHSNRRTKRVFYPNLARKKILIDGNPQRVYVCSTCLKSGKALTA